MKLESLFYLTQSIEAILGAIILLVLVILLIYLFLGFRKVNRQFMLLMNEGHGTVQDARRYVNEIGRAVIDLILVKSMRIINKNRKEGRHG